MLLANSILFSYYFNCKIKNFNLYKLSSINKIKKYFKIYYEVKIK